MSPTSARTVSIVDDDAQVRRFLVEVLDSIGVVAEEFPSGEDFMRRWRPEGVGCVLLDVRMPRVTGPEVHDWLREQKSEVPVIFLSGFADVATAVRAMRLGAFDFLEKPFNVQQLIERVNAALRRVETMSPRPADPGAHWLATLTPREHDVLNAIVEGKRNKIIAADLGISERTVETHRANIMAKAGAQTGAELVAKAISRDSATH